MHLRKSKITIVVVVYTMILLLAFGLFNVKDSEFLGLDIKSEENTVGTITVDNTIEQTFISEYNGLTKIELLLATYGRDNNSNVSIKVSDNYGNIIFSNTVPATNFKDNSYYTLDFDTVRNSKGKEYHISISSDTNDIANAITVWASVNDNYTNGKLYLNNIENKFDIAFRTLYSNNVNSINLLIFCVLAFLCSAISAIIYLMKETENKITFYNLLFWFTCSFFLAIGIMAFYNKIIFGRYSLHLEWSLLGLIKLMFLMLSCLFVTNILFFRFYSVIKNNYLKNIIFGIITIIIVLCTISLLTINSVLSDRAVAKVISSDEYAALNLVACHIETNENGNIFYVPDNNESYVSLPAIDTPINSIKVKFVSYLTENATIQLHCEKNNGEILEDSNIIAIPNIGESSVTFIFDEDCYSAFRLAINESYSIEYIELGTNLNESYSTFYEINVRSIVLLIIIILGLLFIEKKFGYYAFMRSIIDKEFNTCLKIKQEQTMFYFLLHILANILKIIYICLYLVFITKGIINENNIITIFLLSIMILMVSVVDIICNSEKAFPAKLFLTIALIVCSMMAFCFPLNGISLDDGIHYTQSTQLRYMLYGEEYTEADYDGWMIIHDGRLNSIESAKICQKLIYKDAFDVYREKPTANLYNYLGYLPIATTMFICDLFNISFVSMLVLSKLSCAFMYIIVIYSGMKKLKSGQLIMSSIALMPNCLYLASNFSYDPWVIAFTMYSFAYFISEMQQPEKPIGIKDIFLMLGAMLIGCGPKAIYFTLAIPFLLMRKEKLGTKSSHRRYMIFVAITMLIILSSFMMPFLNSTSNYSDMRGGADVNSAEQVKYILNNPITYTKTFLNFFMYYVSIGQISHVLCSYYYLGQNLAEGPTVCIIIMFLCALWDKERCDKFEHVLAFKLTTYATLFVQVLLICTALYISFTPVGLDTINGVSQRYLHPLLFPLLYCIGSVHTKTQIKPKFMKGFIYGTLSINIIWCTYTIYICPLIN